MAGSRCFAKGMLFRQSIGWWWCLLILAVGGCRGVLAADSAAVEPSAAVACGEEGGCTCYRPLSDVIWGFLVTLLALAVSSWGSRKQYIEGAAVSGIALFFAFFTPLGDLARIIENSQGCISLLWKCHKMEFPDSHIMSPSWLKFLCSSLFPWSKSPVRILVNCDVFVYVSKESPLLRKEWLWTADNQVFDESEAIVVGENAARANRDDQFERKQMNAHGIGWLVWKEVFFKPEDSKRLPKYNALKYLRGNSGFATIAIAIQALGYIYAVGFRDAKNLRMVFNTILLMKTLSYSICNPCYRPLVIYMDKEWEDEFDEVNDNDWKKYRVYTSQKNLVSIYFCVFVVLSFLLIYFTLKMARATNVLVTLPIIVFSSGYCLQFLGIIFMLVGKYYSVVPAIVIFLACLVNIVVYIWAMVGTVLYWKTMHFNVRGELTNLSQIIPFIG